MCVGEGINVFFFFVLPFVGTLFTFTNCYTHPASAGNKCLFDKFTLRAILLKVQWAEKSNHWFYDMKKILYVINNVCTFLIRSEDNWKGQINKVLNREKNGENRQKRSLKS